jgi:hypothetical protein
MPGRVPRAEMDAVFLCESLDDVEFFVGFGLHPSVDVWKVDTAGLDIEDAPDGWVLHRAPIPASRVSLHEADRDSTRRALSTVALSFASSRLSVEEMTQLAGISPDQAGSLSGVNLGLESDAPHAYWLIEGSDPYRPLAEQTAEVLGRIEAAEVGLSRLGAMCERVDFRAYLSDPESGPVNWELDPTAKQLLARIHAVVEHL